MNDHLELAMAMLAILFSAVLLLSGLFYIEHRATIDPRDFAATRMRQAGTSQDADIRFVTERSPYMRSER